MGDLTFMEILQVQSYCTSLAQFVLTLTFYITAVHLSKQRNQHWDILLTTKSPDFIWISSVFSLTSFLFQNPNQDTMFSHHVSLVSSALCQFLSLSL